MKAKRVSLDSLVQCYWDGMSPETIQSNFPKVTLEEVYGAITFYLANRAAVDKSIAEEEIAFEKWSQANLRDYGDLYARMKAARADLMVGQK